MTKVYRLTSICIFDVGKCHLNHHTTYTHIYFARCTYWFEKKVMIDLLDCLCYGTVTFIGCTGNAGNREFHFSIFSLPLFVR